MGAPCAQLGELAELSLVQGIAGGHRGIAGLGDEMGDDAVLQRRADQRVCLVLKPDFFELEEGAAIAVNLGHPASDEQRSPPVLRLDVDGMPLDQQLRASDQPAKGVAVILTVPATRPIESPARSLRTGADTTDCRWGCCP